MVNWTLETTANWIIIRCREDRVGHPSSVGLRLQPDELQDDDPDWSSICMAIDFLRAGDDPWITAKPEHILGSGEAAFWQNIKLTPNGLVRALSAEEQRIEIGFEFEE